MVWNIQKWPIQRRGEVASALALKSMSPFTSQKCQFILRIVLLFSRNAILFSRSAFLFLKISYCFPELPISFAEALSFYLLHISFSFSSWLCLLVLHRVAQRGHICLAPVSFPLGTLYWPTYDASLITLKPLHGVWFFMYFIQISVSLK